MDSIRTVVFMADQRGVGEDLYRCKETGKVYIRQECDEEYVRWLTSNKWIGGYEASCPMREGLELHIVGKDGSPLFRESIVKAPGYSDTVAEKIAPFSWEAIGAMAGEQAMKLRLRDYYGWKEWLLKSADEVGFTGENDTWLYAKVERGPVEKVAKLSFLGKTVWLACQTEWHTDCGKRWISYEIRSEDLMAVEAMCGFDF